MADCLFCKIIAGEIPSTKVYEDDSVLAFRDIDPKAPTHILVIPKDHYVSIHDVPEEKSSLFADLMSAVSSIVRQENLVDGGYRLVVNSGSDGGQIVDHIHVHILGGRKLTPSMG